MADYRDQITRLARRVHTASVERNVPTRTTAIETLMTVDDLPLLRRMSAEFLVELIARSAARQQQQQTPQRPADEPDPVSKPARLPRKGSAARAEWEATDEGKAYVAAIEQADEEAMSQMFDSLKAAAEKYAASLRVTWATEILDRTFRDETGVPVTWGEATIEQHAHRRRSLLANAARNTEDAALHEVAIRDLEASRAVTLRLLVEGDAA